ncbi:hemolysin XhlA [Yersinia ruckeri]|uniref:hemolysin XhlA n=1 Tax=Yersinia ruckeri TaxID=29486 RepID=UPI0020BF1D48|nr:hemolysin XhlA [Yersinia ruckeri]MCK8543194.1 hemolysin XhlA [Yersinia ruckeri]MCK8552771.1 hemolysin XhlA [Yersinia ruckeri]MCW6519799.1 hemolysin XhlA [Yersinia ruckeri]MCW6550955.1 hemolysin XhlA [Yersinia ruckeri]MCW6558329.1 hemolysin XhlA [Yersinia ruckeri]
MSTHDSNVVPFTKDVPTLPVKHGGGDGGGDSMLEKRVKQIEDSLAEIRTDMAVIKSNYATKEDIASVRIEVHQSITAQTKWLAATMIAIAGISMAIAKLIF